MDKAFYTYTIFIDGVPVYVGKGKDIRCFDHLYEKPQLKDKPLSIKVEWAASAAEALDREHALIQEYAPRGTLLNIVMNPLRRRVMPRKKRPVTPEVDLSNAIKWGRKGHRKFGGRTVPAQQVAGELLDEANHIAGNVRIPTPSWYEGTTAWLSDHEHYEVQVPGWARSHDTGFAQVMAERRRVERILGNAREYCDVASDEAYLDRLKVVLKDHPWLEHWEI